MGGADFITVLFAEFLRYDPDNMAYPHRDRFFLDPGHMSPMLYATLSLAGHYTTEDLQSLRQWGSVTPGHPEVDVLRGVENTSGPLGQGHAMALGAAIAERFLAARFGEWTAHRTYAYISDGSVEEEISQGVGRIAGHLGLSNFVMYYDANNVQLSTKVDEVDTENVAMKYEAWGWNVLSIDGNNINAIREALVAAESETERPTLIIGRTVMGKGARGPPERASRTRSRRTASRSRPPGRTSGPRSAIWGAIPNIRSPSSTRAARCSPSGARRCGLGPRSRPPSRSRGARSIRSWRAGWTGSSRASFPRSTTRRSR